MAKYITEPEAKVLADSVAPNGARLTTMEVTMHRFVLAEFNTHRVFSRNSASSRAIPGRLHRKRVLETPAVPLEWPQKQSGMQGGTSVPPEIQIESERIWSQAADYAVAFAQRLDDLGIHKSVTNRLLEPFLWHTVLVTSTEWDNFFEQRDSEQAQPEIAVPARLMREAYEASEPDTFEYEASHGLPMWHAPLIDEATRSELIEMAASKNGAIIGTAYTDEFVKLRNKVSVARCARVSYLNHDGDRNIEDDLALYKKLETYGHWSPFEHVATPCHGGYVMLDGEPVERGISDHYHKGNFHGWDQLRHLTHGTEGHQLRHRLET